MGEFPVKMHLFYKDIYNELQTYKTLKEGKEDERVAGFEKYLFERHYHDTRPFWEFSLEECVDEQYHQYPNDEWLAAIIDNSPFLESLKHGDILLEQLEAAWNWGYDPDFFSFDEETKILTAYTGGWSGCEDIMFTLNRAFPFFMTNCEHCVLKFDMKHFFNAREEESDEQGE